MLLLTVLLWCMRCLLALVLQARLVEQVRLRCVCLRFLVLMVLLQMCLLITVLRCVHVFLWCWVHRDIDCAHSGDQISSDSQDEVWLRSDPRPPQHSLQS
jgi:hypothetical protein